MKLSDNEIYLLIKYIKSVLWRVAKRLSYIEDARSLKFNTSTLRCVISQQSADLSKFQTLWEIRVFESPRLLLLFSSD